MATKSRLTTPYPSVWFAGSSRSVKLRYRYQPVLVDENQEIADWLLRITASQRNSGLRMLLYLRNVQGFG